MKTASSVASSLREGTPQGEETDQNHTATVSFSAIASPSQNP